MQSPGNLILYMWLMNFVIYCYYKMIDITNEFYIEIIRLPETKIVLFRQSFYFVELNTKNFLVPILLI